MQVLHSGPKHTIEARSFDTPLPQHILDIEDKNRSNLFTWRGQFSPQLIENLLAAYCPKDSIVLDPFVGSGTVLCEAGSLGLESHGFELNPAAWILARTYHLINTDYEVRKNIIRSFTERVKRFFDEPQIFDWKSPVPISLEDLTAFIRELQLSISDEENIIFEALIVLLDLANHKPTVQRLHTMLNKLANLIVTLPFSNNSIYSRLADARRLPLTDGSVDFVVTSPPYINVFNYHQNYRRSTEVLGWDLLKIARSEIGSNRANRGNRFLTVIQYCLDMSLVLQELHRVCHSDTRIIMVLGHESNVLGVPFFNANIIEHLATQTGMFEICLKQKRIFRNKFGRHIREDLLHLSCRTPAPSRDQVVALAQTIAFEVLNEGLDVASKESRPGLTEAISKINTVRNTPFLDRDSVSQ